MDDFDSRETLSNIHSLSHSFCVGTSCMTIIVIAITVTCNMDMKSDIE